MNEDIEQMMGKVSYPEEKALDLLKQLEHILESDPQIDEVGFIHPSQFVTLNEEAGGSLSAVSDSMVSEISDVEAPSINNMIFWNRDHKLGISTQVLLPLYKVTKHAFMAASRQYVIHGEASVKNNQSSRDEGCSIASPQSIFEIEVMKHSRALLILSCDFGTAWNSRKLVLSKKQNISLFMDELLLSALVLSYSPKSDHAWSHRRWVIKMIAGKCSNLQDIVKKESELVGQIAEKFKMNYRAWTHRGWLVSYMTNEQVLHELMKSRNWAGLHVADNCCFHYRRRLLLRILDCNKQGPDTPFISNIEICQLWKEELDWDEELLNRYTGIEALWLHRRFLSLYWIKHFATNLGVFLDNELHLFHKCSTIPDNEYEDYQAQAVFSATYFLWLTKIIDSVNLDVREKLRAVDLKILLNSVCPEKTFLWDGLMEEF